MKVWDGKAVRELRKEFRLSQQQLAELLQTRQATVSNWERGATTPEGLAAVALTYLERDLRRQSDTESDIVGSKE